MPSFRVTISIGALHPNVRPESVLPAAADAARELTSVEATDVNVVRGSARITVRFTADNDVAAARVASHTVAATRTLAEVASATITRRDGGRWYPLQL